jgi:hypothetical protein
MRWVIRKNLKQYFITMYYDYNKEGMKMNDVDMSKTVIVTIEL